MNQIIGKQSLRFENDVFIENSACITGSKEGDGPLGHLFDQIVEDPYFGTDNWDAAESRLQKMTIDKMVSKMGLSYTDYRYVFGGDLLGQLIGTTFGIVDCNIPFFGLYGACSTFGEAVTLGAMTVNAGYANRVISLASSHFASAEKQFRFPLEYGNQRPLSATWTVTGCGCVSIGAQGGIAKLMGVTTGKVVDFGVKDSMNMGACMAPAAADTIYQNFMDFGIDAGYYDKIITGDLGMVGQRILFDLLKEKGFDISGNHMDCGIEIFDAKTQDTHSGGSGCGCSAVTFCSYVLRQIVKGKWKRVLFVPTGALLSPISYNEGNSVPGIAHGFMVTEV